MKVMQGDIFLADLNPVMGHEQAGYRPVLIMQNDVLNRNLNTVMIAPITSNLKARGRLTTFFLPVDESGLDRDSVVLLFQMRTIDKLRLEKKISNLGAKSFAGVKSQLKFVF